MTRIRTAIETCPTGTLFDFADPQPEMIHIEDIARSLSMQCRFGGHVKRFYSVAEHALLVSRLAAEVAGPEEAFAALHHDSTEAYLLDVPRPAKPRFGTKYSALTRVIDEAIGARFGIDPDLFHHDIVKAADEQALAIEATVLKNSRVATTKSGDTAPVDDPPTGAVACHDPAWAEAMFLAAHYRLAGDAAMLRLGGGV